MRSIERVQHGIHQRGLALSGSSHLQNLESLLVRGIGVALECGRSNSLSGLAYAAGCGSPLLATERGWNGVDRFHSAANRCRRRSLSQASGYTWFV